MYLIHGVLVSVNGKGLNRRLETFSAACKITFLAIHSILKKQALVPYPREKLGPRIVLQSASLRNQHGFPLFRFITSGVADCNNIVYKPTLQTVSDSFPTYI